MHRGGKKSAFGMGWVGDGFCLSFRDPLTPLLDSFAREGQMPVLKTPPDPLQATTLLAESGKYWESRPLSQASTETSRRAEVLCGLRPHERVATWPVHPAQPNRPCWLHGSHPALPTLSLAHLAFLPSPPPAHSLPAHPTHPLPSHQKS